jgi:cardiolipin synthase
MRSLITSAFTNRNEVKLVRSGLEYFDIVENLIGQAQDYIHLQTYIFSDDETGNRVVKALQQARSKGVKIFLVVDGYASQDLPKHFIQQLRQSGIDFIWFEPLLKSNYFYFGRRLHHKVLVVDGEHGLVGGINISDRYNDTVEATAWLDYAVYLRGEAVAQLQTICEQRTILRKRYFDGKKIVHPMKIDRWPSTGDCLVGIRVNDWVRRKKEITKSYLRMLNGAEKKVTILSPYFIPGNAILQAIKKAARRGVQIELILAGVSDVQVAKCAERFIYQKLFVPNVKIFEYQPNILHGKVGTCDGQWTTIGSYNINNISAYASIELNVEILSHEFTSVVCSELETIRDRDCLLVTEEHYEKVHTLADKIKLRFAYYFFRAVFFLTTFYFRQRRG